MHTLKKFIVTFTGTLLLLTQLQVQADDNLSVMLSNDTCAPVVDNYLDAIGEFQSILEAMIPISSEKDVTAALKDAENGIKNNNITYNAMQAYDGAIKAELKKHPNSALNAGMSQLDSQLSSLHTRVDQWKKTGCREKHSCDLGEPGYCSKKQ